MYPPHERELLVNLFRETTEPTWTQRNALAAAVLPETFPVPGTVNPQNVPRERGTFPGNVDLNFINEISSFLIY